MRDRKGKAELVSTLLPAAVVEYHDQDARQQQQQPAPRGHIRRRRIKVHDDRLDEHIGGRGEEDRLGDEQQTPLALLKLALALALDREPSVARLHPAHSGHETGDIGDRRRRGRCLGGLWCVRRRSRRRGGGSVTLLGHLD